MLDQLANLQPIIIIVLLIAMYSLEMGRPYLPRPADPKNARSHTRG
jgi:hypothetical protein